MQEIYTVQSAILETELLTHTISALVLNILNSVSPILGIYRRQIKAAMLVLILFRWKELVALQIKTKYR